jgi:hypothetical protein
MAEILDPQGIPLLHQRYTLGFKPQLLAPEYREDMTLWVLPTAAFELERECEEEDDATLEPEC